MGNGIYRFTYKRKKILVFFHNMPKDVEGLVLHNLCIISGNAICINSKVSKKDIRKVFHRLIKELFNN